jgi:uncharacterized protein (DUF4415 family)
MPKDPELKARALADLASITDEEEARIQAGIAQDPDNPELTEADFARMRPAAELHPELVERWRRTRGPQRTPTKRLVSLRLDPDLLERLRAGGPGWQRRANDLLRRAVGL